MAISLKHTFTSPKTDGSDSTLVQPSNWNEEHVLTQATARLLGRTTAGTGPTEEISVSADFTLAAGTLSLAADFLVTGNNLSDLVDPAAALANLGVTATALELNTLDGITATATELNQLDGVIISSIGSTIIQDADENAVLASLTIQSHNTAAWEAGTETRPAVVSPASVATAVDAQVPGILNASGSAPLYACRAWVNFNGTGTVAIRASGNVSSITDDGVGNYTINFTTAMPDANYAVLGTAMGDISTLSTFGLSGASDNLQTTTGASVRTVNLNTSSAHGAGSDAAKVFVAFFR